MRDFARCYSLSSIGIVVKIVVGASSIIPHHLYAAGAQLDVRRDGDQA
jgi:hypothetical protein